MVTGHRPAIQLQLIAGTGTGDSADGRRPAAPRRPRRRTSGQRRLDAETRQIGREGVAQAREILSQITPPDPTRQRQAS
jgi:hypothetical protein